MDTEENLLFTPAEFQIAKIQIVFFLRMMRLSTRVYTLLLQL